MVAARSDKLLPFRSARRIDYSAGAPTKEHWVRLAASWIKADAKAKSRSPESLLLVTQKRPLVSHFPPARWVALGRENESTGMPESSKRHWKNESGYWRKKGGRQSAAG
jgi:hypothetical protein